MAQTQSSQIIVLHLTKYGDSSLVVHSIDSAAGRCSYLLRGVGKGGSRSPSSRKGSSVSVGSFHNLAVLDIVSVSNPRSSMAYLKEYEPVLQLTSLRSDMHKSSIALFISELLYRTIVEQNCDERLFSWLTDAIAKLDAFGRDSARDISAGDAATDNVPGTAATYDTDMSAVQSIANFHLWFLAGFCTVMGFGPSRTGDFDGSDLLSPENLALLRQLAAGDFSPRQAGLSALTSVSASSERKWQPSGTAHQPAGNGFEHMPAGNASGYDSNFQAAMAIPLSGHRRTDFCGQMIRYISYHLGMNLHIRSLDVLHQLYS